MPLVRRRPLLRAAAAGTIAYQASKRGAMAGQQQQQQYAEPPAAPPPAAPAAAPAPEDPTVEKIKQLAELHAQGALTDGEFQAAKAKLLGLS